MNRELQLLKRALADVDFAAAVAKPQHDSDHFSYFAIKLPPSKFRGFPPTWDFAILHKHEGSLPVEQVIADAEALAQRTIQRAKNETRLVFLSDDPRIVLHEELLFSEYLVFCIDAKDLPSISKLPSQLYLTPLSLAIRRTLEKNDFLSLVLNPYMRNLPVTGWRFYGRRKELDRLIASEENFIIVGGRRIGKTSLMAEAHRRLKERNQRSYFLSAEACKTPAEVVQELVRTISQRDTESALRKSKALNEKLLVSLLKQISSSSAPATIFIDELGLVIASRPTGDDWGFLGSLRLLSQQGRLRVVFSCFQEVFLSQRTEFAGPLVNFGTIMRLSVFADSEVDEILFGPLELWHSAGDERRAVRDLVLSGVGRHPLLLQYFCHELFERVSSGGERKLLGDAQRILGKDLADCFSEPVNEIFMRFGSPLLCYLFLKHCMDIERAQRPLLASEIGDDWLIEALKGLGFSAGFFERRVLLEALEVRGLTFRPEQSNGDRQVVASPIIYKYLKATESDLSRVMNKLAGEVSAEAPKWRLTHLTTTEGGS